jgi:hypothetical protein
MEDLKITDLKEVCQKKARVEAQATPERNEEKQVAKVSFFLER